MGGFFFQIEMEHPALAPAFHLILTGPLSETRSGPSH